MVASGRRERESGKEEGAWKGRREEGEEGEEEREEEEEVRDV